jgi:hypothetical protein
MDIITKFSKFLNELNEARTVDLPILDVVIDDDGIVHNGEEADLVKGRVQRETGRIVTRILGTDNKDYPAGIDKNGNVVALATDSENRALNSKGQPIPVPQFIQKKYRIGHQFYYQDPEFDYYSIIPIMPTGWINVKVDMEIVKRVKRYAKTLGTNNRGHESFLSKLNEFERLSTQTRSQQYISRLKRNTIQKEMSAILLLHYINEIKDFFNPSQGGFLFESFIAGLIPDSRVKEDNSPVDIRTSTERYQLKFVDSKAGYVDVTKDVDPGRSAWLEYYMIALKYVDRIDLYVVDGRVLEQRYNDGTIGDLITPGGRPDPKTGKVKSGPKFSMSKVMAVTDTTLVKKFTIELTDIDGRIKNLGESLKLSLKELYDELSKFQFNVETIITGVNEKGKIIRDQFEFDVYHLSAEKNISNLANHLKRLVSDINK